MLAFCAPKLLRTKKAKAAALGSDGSDALLGEVERAKRRNDYAVRLDLIDSADLSECNTSPNIKAVNDVTASSMSDGARLPGISSVLRCSGTYPPPNIEKTWVLCVLWCIGNLPSSVAAP
jgi:hypothetical protein